MAKPITNLAVRPTAPVVPSNPVAPNQPTTPTGVGSVAGVTDNLITSGMADSWSGWTVDAASYKTNLGMILHQTQTTDNLIFDVPAAKSTSYWMRLVTDLRSPGASTGNVRLVALADTGCEIAGPAGALINIGGAGTGFIGTSYVLVTTGATQAVFGKSRMVLKHASSPDTSVCTADFTTGRITQASHGFVNTQPFKLLGAVAPTGLSFSTRYYVINKTTNDFQISLTPDGPPVTFSDNGTSLTISNFFRIIDVTLFPIPERSAAKVTVFGDRTSGYTSGVADPVSTAVVDVARGDAVNIVHPGDLSDGSFDLNTTTGAMKTTIEGRGGKIYSAPGNWDYQAVAGIAGWNTWFGLDAGQSKRYRSVVLGFCEYFFYDTNTENTDNGGQSSVAVAKASAMGQWLIAAIAASQAKWKVVVMHHPAYSSSTHHSGPSDQGSWPAQNKAMQWDWASMGVKLVIQSHDHVVSRMLVNGTTFYTIALGGGSIQGSFGTPIAESKFRSLLPGYMKISDSQTKLVLEYFDSPGNMLDRYAIT